MISTNDSVKQLTNEGYIVFTPEVASAFRNFIKWRPDTDWSVSSLRK